VHLLDNQYTFPNTFQAKRQALLINVQERNMLVYLFKHCQRICTLKVLVIFQMKRITFSWIFLVQNVI